MAKQASIRASDADRERIADHLRRAAAEGRILTEELEQRLSAAFSARTYGELDPLVSDLPVGRSRTAARRRPTALALAGYSAAIVLALLVVFVVVMIAVGLLAFGAVWIVLGWALFGRHRAALARGRHRGSVAWSGGCTHRRVEPSRSAYRL
jgi:uncharacterized protein DUF1707